MVGSKPKRLLASEIGRLVYGYLGKVHCSKTQKVFLEENKVLKEIAAYVEKELIRSIDMEIEGQHLEDILNGYITIKFEVDKLFEELQLKKPELYAFKSDGPLRKLQVLESHWKSQHRKHLDRSPVVGIEAANSEAHRMLSKKTRSPVTTTKKTPEPLQLVSKEGDLTRSSSISASIEEDKEKVQIKSRKSLLKSRVPTRCSGISMPILSGFEIRHEVKKRIEAFTQQTDEKIINSVVAEPLAHILAKTNEVDTAVENFLSNDDLLNNFTQVLDEVWATDCKKASEKQATSATSALLSTPHHQPSEFIDSDTDQGSFSVFPSSQSPVSSSNDTSWHVPGAQMSTPDEKVTGSVKSDNPPRTDRVSTNGSESLNLTSNGNLPSSLSTSNEKSLKSPKSSELLKNDIEKKASHEQNTQLKCVDSSAIRNDNLSSEVVSTILEAPENTLNSSRTFLEPSRKPQPRVLPLMAEQEVHLVNILPSQTNDVANRLDNPSDSLSSSKATPQVILAQQSHTSEAENMALGMKFNDPSLKLHVASVGKSLEPLTATSTNLNDIDHRAVEMPDKSLQKSVPSSKVRKSSAQLGRKTCSVKEKQIEKVSVVKAEVENLQVPVGVRKSNRLAQKSNQTIGKPKSTPKRKKLIEKSNVQALESKEPPKQQSIGKASVVPLVSNAESSSAQTDIVSIFHLDENALQSPDPLLKEDTDDSGKKVPINEDSPSFRQIFKGKSTTNLSQIPVTPLKDPSLSDTDQVVGEGRAPRRQDSEGSQTLCSLSQLFSPLSTNLSVSSTVLNEMLKNNDDSLTFSGLNSSCLFSESFDVPTSLPEMTVHREQTQPPKDSIERAALVTTPTKSSTSKPSSDPCPSAEGPAPSVTGPTTGSSGGQEKPQSHFISPSKRLPRKVPLVRVPITGVRIQPGQFCSQWEEQHNVNNLDNYTTRAKPQVGSTVDTNEAPSLLCGFKDPDARHNAQTKKRKREADSSPKRKAKAPLVKISVPSVPQDIISSLKLSQPTLTCVNYKVYFAQDPFVENLMITD